MTEIVVFGRPPVPGRVKTRLARALGPVAAAEVYRALLDHTLERARDSGLRYSLALAEPPEQPASWLPPDGVNTSIQAQGDLGTRMRCAFADRLSAGAGAVILIGSDLPGLAAGHFRQAAAILARVPVVLGPAADGGYWLVGQRAPGFDLFSGIPWSSPQTLRATRARLRDLHVPHEELPKLRDLDTMADLEANLADPGLDGQLRTRLESALARRPTPP